LTHQFVRCPACKVAVVLTETLALTGHPVGHDKANPVCAGSGTAPAGEIMGLGYLKHFERKRQQSVRRNKSHTTRPA